MKSARLNAFARHALVVIFACACLVLLVMEGKATFYQFLAFVGAFATGIMVVKLDIGKL